MAIGAWVRHYFNSATAGGTPGGSSLTAREPASIALAIAIPPRYHRGCTQPGRPQPPRRSRRSSPRDVPPAIRSRPTEPGYGAPPAGHASSDPGAEIEAERRADRHRSPSSTHAMPLAKRHRRDPGRARHARALARLALGLGVVLEIASLPASPSALALRGGRRPGAPSPPSSRSCPFEDRIIHCRWSGESNWIPWGDRELGIGAENATCYPAHRASSSSTPGGMSETLSCALP